MFRSYFQSLFRNILRNKFYTFLNILGLSIGIFTALLILLYVQDELSYDKHHANHKRIYRLESAFTTNNNQDLYATVPIPIGPALKLEIPEIQTVVRLDRYGQELFIYNEREYIEDNFFMADSTVFDVFTHAFIAGNPETCLTSPNSIVLTESTAEKYFLNENPMGKVISIKNGVSYKITGIIKDVKGNSHLQFDALISISSDVEKYNITKASRFWRVGVYTFILINENVTIDDVLSKWPAFYTKYMEDLGTRYKVHYDLLATPLTDTHFKQGLAAELPAGNKSYILIFLAIAFFILLIAAINYMNMATARSANRAKEVGIRKVLGAQRNLLIQQFLIESVTLSVIALIFALFAVWIILPAFNDFSGKLISLSVGENAFIFLEIILITIFIGILSGSYPAFYLSAFDPAAVLKGSVSKSGTKSLFLRRVLVVVQFFIAVFMIISSLVISGQLNFIRQKDLGFEKENIVVLEIHDNEFYNNIPAFIEELRANPNILSVTNATGIPGKMNRIQTMYIEQEEEMKFEPILFAQTDFDYLNTFNIEVITGRNFNKEMGTDDREAVIINEAMAYNYGWIKDPIGKNIEFGRQQDGSGARPMKVIGVVKDYHFKSLHNSIEPIVLFISEEPSFFICCRVNDENKKEAVAFMEQKWIEFGNNYPFQFNFLDDEMDEMYVTEDKISTIINITTLLTIFIALLGLLGLSSFIAEQKNKEIGIRKIHGASIGSILYLLYKDFFVLFVIAYVIAIPVSWWRLGIWLESSFVYFQTLSWTTFLIAGILSLTIGILTISFYIIKAASGKPIEAVKCE
jgi:putative ABC transport system permease protein